MKTYTGNYDGIRQGLVRAKNKKEAASVANSSLYHFNQYWQSVPIDGDYDPNTLYTKMMLSTDNFVKGVCPKHSGRKYPTGALIKEENAE